MQAFLRRQTPVFLCPAWAAFVLAGLTSSRAALADDTPQGVPPDVAPEATPSVSPPKLVSYQPAQVPEGLVLEQPTHVDLQLQIDVQGRVSSVTVQSGDTELSQAASLAAAQFVFEPARQGQTPVPVLIDYRYWFEANVTPPPKEEEAEAAPSAKQLDPTGNEAPAPGVQAPRATPDPEEEIFEAVAEIAAPPRETTRRTLKKERLTKVPGTRGDAIRAVETLPGVSRTTMGSMPLIRGASETESIALIDGTHVPFLYHFGGLTSFVHPQLVDSVDLYPGNFSARYGRATGGVVEAHLRAPAREFHLLADINLLDSSVLAEGPLTEQIRAAAAVRRSNIDFAFDTFVPDGAFDVVVAPLYWDYQALVQFDYSRRGMLRLTAFGSRDALDLKFDEPNDDDPTLRSNLSGAIEFHKLQVMNEHRLGGVKEVTQVTVGLQALKQQLGPTTRAYFDISEIDARSEWTFPVGTTSELIAGVDVVGQRLVGAYSGSAASSQEGSLDIPDSSRAQVVVEKTVIPIVNPAVYVEARLHPTESLLLVPGVRVDYFHDIRALTVNPRLTQRYSLTEDTTLKTGVGLFSQPPLYYEAFDPIGNPKLNPYHALHTSLGIEQRWGDEVRLDLEGFYKRLYDRVVDTEGGIAPYFVNDGKGRIYGAETGLTLTPNPQTYAQASYTLSRSERRDRDQAWRLFDQDQTHILSVVAGYQLGAGWEVGGRFRYVTGNPVTLVEGSAFDAGAGTYTPIFGAHNAARDPAFHQLDVRVQKAFTIGTGKLTAYLDVQNVYFAENLEGFSYSYDYQEREGVSASPFFPNLGLRGEL